MSGGIVTGHQGLGRASALARNWWVVALRGAFAITFGVIAFAWPGVTLSSLVLLFGAYMVVDGVFAIASGVRAAARHERWVALIAEGALDLVAGLIAFAMPILTIYAFVVLAGAWAVISGAMMLWAAIALHAAHRWLMAIGGLISVAWGVLLFVEPITGALVMTWWIGGYALFFGAALIALGLRLRGLRGVLV